MCGICGILGSADENALTRMSAAVAHRGPDDVGVYVHPGQRIALGHRRLAILDLSSAGHQPMSTADGRYWITYNGEIYNFREIRNDLQEQGAFFKSDNDAEVILAAYARWGAASLERLRGMFAFAIWDAEKQELFLARDRFGIKPLYWAQCNGVFLFASQLKAMMASGLIARQLDVQALWDYLSFYCVPAPSTILKNVHALLPGHSIIVRDANVSIHQYWDLPNGSNAVAQMQPEEIQSELRRLLDESTRLHLIADVPVGAFLSGGVDSTAIVGLMAGQIAKPLQTYSLGFDSAGASLSELPFAQIAARHFGADHHEYVLTGEEVAREFDHLIDAIDQPSGDGVNSYFVSKIARTGVTVALSGLGGDELFAGYPQFRAFRDAETIEHDALLARLARLTGPVPRGLKYRLGLAMLDGIGEPWAERFSRVRLLYDESEKHSLVNSRWIDDQLKPAWTCLAQYSSRETDAITLTSYVEAKTYMANMLLRDVDAMSMAHALEVRVPFLDHVLAEFIFRIPSSLKLNGTTSKKILIDALADILPAPIARRRKMGFELPMRQWLGGPLRPIARETLHGSVARKLFVPNALSRMQTTIDAGRSGYMLVWAPLVLAAWLARNKVDLDAS